ncbi:SWI/SNF complex component SNF12 [Cinnamomum micranthum f. kanehirae]|uniref:SWI/SNF complex component SNF12 n=1 Tax=Cinnamomum micranthum f. kanehirae TaxID=337451 RepID=A0A443NN30_9MAGN|nr:SWI/SNF complex component SNF12 [Cinnamomum micranthum f. kanehirae]
MESNNNNPQQTNPSPLGNAAGSVPPLVAAANQLSHLHPPSQSQSQSPFQAPIQISQAQILAQMHAQNQARTEAARAQFQAQLQAQGLGASSPSPSLSTPGTASAKRAPQKPPAARPPGPTSAATMASPFKTTELTPAARRKKRKLPEKQLPDRVAALLPESALYTQLLEFEARVDSALLRKKTDIQESLKNPPCIQRTLRIYVFNTFSNQTRVATRRQNPEPPTWTLRIIGRILEDEADGDPAGGGISKPTPQYPKFSTFFKRVSIALDPSLYPESPTIMWESARSPAQHEGFEIKRKGDKEFNVNIRLEMNYMPEKFKLSLALREVLGIEVDTRPRIIAAIWHYVKAKKLQIPSDPSFFACDPPLRNVFGEEKMKFAMVSQKISQHLSPPQPIHLEHRIKLSGNSPAGNACYDVLVDIPFPIQKEMSAFLANAEKHKEIDACEELICNTIKRIHEHRRRRAFFLGFSQNPVEFINAVIASQSRDLKLLAGEATRNAERERRSDFYNQPWVEDAVIRYLNRKPAGGNDAPGST